MIQIACSCGAVVTVLTGQAAKCEACGAEYRRAAGAPPMAFRRVSPPGLLAKVASWFRPAR